MVELIQIAQWAMAGGVTSYVVYFIVNEIVKMKKKDGSIFAKPKGQKYPEDGDAETRYKREMIARRMPLPEKMKVYPCPNCGEPIPWGFKLHAACGWTGEDVGHKKIYAPQKEDADVKDVTDEYTGDGYEIK